jgi:hypothetical protein
MARMGEREFAVALRPSPCPLPVGEGKRGAGAFAIAGGHNRDEVFCFTPWLSVV